MFSLTSPAFAHQHGMPAWTTCDGDDRSPGLSWSGVPDGTQSFALVCDDPDAPDPAAPQRTWVHWILYNIPANMRFLEEGVLHLPPGTAEGLNDWGRTGYGGPCPPIGRHRYFFTLLALDAVLPDLGTPTKRALFDAAEPHLVGKAVLVGTYQRSGR